MNLQPLQKRPKSTLSAESPEILAQRLFIYLRVAGIEPVAPEGASPKQILAAYNQQWNALPAYCRSYARRTSRAQMLASGLTNSLAAVALVSAQRPPVAPPVLKRETVAVQCPHCRMRGGFPKRAWLSRQLAEEALLRALEIPENFKGLRIYECAHMPGHWHLGHLQEDASTKPRTAQAGENSRLSEWVVTAGLLAGIGLIRLLASRKR
jgi:hypothetical protein